MSLVGNDMGDAIFNALVNEGVLSVGDTASKDVWRVVATAIRDYLVTNTAVSTTVASAIPTTCPAGVGSTTATGSGTGTIS